LPLRRRAGEVLDRRVALFLGPAAVFLKDQIHARLERQRPPPYVQAMIATVGEHASRRLVNSAGYGQFPLGRMIDLHPPPRRSFQLSHYPCESVPTEFIRHDHVWSRKAAANQHLYGLPWAAASRFALDWRRPLRIRCCEHRECARALAPRPHGNLSRWPPRAGRGKVPQPARKGPMRPGRRLDRAMRYLSSREVLRLFGRTAFFTGLAAGADLRHLSWS